MPASECTLSPVADRCLRFVADDVRGIEPTVEFDGTGNCAGAVAGP